MKKITILCVLGLLSPFFWANAQKHYLTKPLNVGESVPDLTLQNIVNFKSKTIRLSEYKDKLIILDFWSTFCEPCIRHMPEIFSLQKQFANRILILPVNSNPRFDTPEKVKKFFNERKKIFNLPSVVCDSVLWNLFKPPHLSTCVWIRNGKVLQITEGDDVNSENINKCLNDIFLTVVTPVRSQDYANGRLFSDNGTSSLPSKYLTRSILFPYDPNIQGSMSEMENGKIKRIYRSNSTIISLLRLANPTFQFGFRIKINSSHPELLSEDVSTDSARQKNLYCYEAIFPPVSPKKAMEYFRQDLLRYFPYTVDSAKIVDSCWVLKLSNTSKIRVGKTSQNGTNIGEHIGLPIYYYNRRLSSLCNELEYFYKIPVLNETGYRSNVWLDLPAEIMDTKEVAKSLAKQGFTLTKELRPIEYMVIKDRDVSN